jgi:hypothetical protein
VESFLQLHGDVILGVLSGFDRILFRGTLRSISYCAGMDRFLGAQRVLYKDFGPFVNGLSEQLKVHAKMVAAQHNRPYIHLESPAQRKEDVAVEVAKLDHITDGLICVLGCVEPCRSYEIRPNAKSSRSVELVSAERRCLHLYYYYFDREFGLMHVRLQTWTPFPIQVCLNGREFLAKQLTKAGIGFEQRDNCFTRIDDLPKAQAILDSLITRNWSRFLNVLVKRVNPLLSPEAGLDLHPYYWTFRDSEYATDVMYRTAADLVAIYPALIGHAIQQFRCRDVLRFLGRRTNARFDGQVTASLLEREEGVRIKHWVESNSIKMYDKEGSVLRIETTICNPRAFKAYREVIRHGQPGLAWIPMRKGLADIARRAEVCRAANQRYLEALSVVKRPEPTHEVLDPVSRRVVKAGRPYRGLRPITAEEARFFSTILRGEHLVQGFRNKDLHGLHADHEKMDARERRRASGRITRLIRLLRAHGLVRKVAKTSYYRVTPKGHLVMTTALRIRDLNLAKVAA